MTELALVLLLEASPASPRDWIVERGGAIELALVHREADRLDGGILTVDPRRRLVIWEGIAGDIGCRLKIEASFDDVRSVAVGEPGFALEFRSPGPASAATFGRLRLQCSDPHSPGHSVGGHGRYSGRRRRHPGHAWAHASPRASLTQDLD